MGRVLKWNQFLLCGIWKVSNDFQLLLLLVACCLLPVAWWPSIDNLLKRLMYWLGPPYETHNPISVLNDFPRIVRPSECFVQLLLCVCVLLLIRFNFNLFKPFDCTCRRGDSLLECLNGRLLLPPVVAAAAAAAAFCGSFECALEFLTKTTTGQSHRLVIIIFIIICLLSCIAAGAAFCLVLFVAKSASSVIDADVDAVAVAGVLVGISFIPIVVVKLPLVTWQQFSFLTTCSQSTHTSFHTLTHTHAHTHTTQHTLECECASSCTFTYSNGNQRCAKSAPSRRQMNRKRQLYIKGGGSWRSGSRRLCS